MCCTNENELVKPYQPLNCYLLPQFFYWNNHSHYYCYSLLAQHEPQPQPQILDIATTITITYDYIAILPSSQPWCYCAIAMIAHIAIIASTSTTDTIVPHHSYYHYQWGVVLSPPILNNPQAQWQQLDHNSQHIIFSGQLLCVYEYSAVLSISHHS